MGNLFDYNSGPVNEEAEQRDEAPKPQFTPKKKRKRESGGDADDDLLSDEGIINPETPRYHMLVLLWL